MMKVSLRREDIYAGNLILVNADYAYCENSYHENVYHENSYHENICHENVCHENGYHENSYYENSCHENAYYENSDHKNNYHENICREKVHREYTCCESINREKTDRADAVEKHEDGCDLKTSRMDTDGKSIWLRQCPAHNLFQLLLKIDGWQQIVAVSGWRSMNEQQQIWADSMKEHGLAFTETYVAVPGHSEHQTGLAIDLGLRQDAIDFIRPYFPYDGICQKFRDTAAEYGFIERYPKDKEYITGIGHEPWHFRFVGMPHAAIIREHGWTLEEYISFLREFPYGKKAFHYENGMMAADVSYIHVGEPETGNLSNAADVKTESIQIELDWQKQYSISGNNVDGFVLTEILYSQML